MTSQVTMIKTERLILRPLDLKDLDTTHEYASDIETTKYMYHLPNKTVKDTEQFLQRVVAEWGKEIPSFYEFTIVLDEKHIGAVSIYLDESKQKGVLGWIINKSYQGNGYATEAAKAVVQYAFDKLKVKKVVAHCDCRNEPSRQVMRKIGLSFESEDERRYKDCDEYIPEFKYSLTI